MDRQKLTLAGIAMVFIGFFVVLAGAATSSGSSSGAFILIGPFPIVFGNGPNSGMLAALGGVITVVVVAVYVMALFRMRRAPGQHEETPPNA